MAWEENSRICLHMQLIAILSRTGVTSITSIHAKLQKVIFKGNKSGTRGRFIKMKCSLYLNIFQNEEKDKQ